MFTLISICVFITPTIYVVQTQEGILFPRESETRETISLNGVWNFVLSPTNDSLYGIQNPWFKNDISQIPGVENYLMPVPSSYNDITQNKKIRDHVGVVWYQRTFFVPKAWWNKQVYLRFSSVSYAARVWVNGELAMKHEIGHLPFQKKINSLLSFGKENRITVACDNTLSKYTIPQGYVQKLKTDTGETLVQQYPFDFYNYAGIDRPVTLYTIPVTSIDDIDIQTNVNGTTGIINYKIKISKKNRIKCVVILVDKEGNNVTRKTGDEGLLTIPSAKFWWPYLMHPEPGYLYTLVVELWLRKVLIDVYRQPLGIRTITWDNKTLRLNNRPLYLYGFGRHEDADIRGKGLDLATAVKDYNLIKWVGGNAYRTSHYQYAEEIMELADQLGIMIINECPGVDIHEFSSQLIENYKISLTQLIQRDKNRPSVIMWSIANDPRVTATDRNFEKIVSHVKTLDRTRPVTMSIADGDKVVEQLDIISFNEYYAWYKNPGELDTIIKSVVERATSLHEKNNKLVLMSEYGADAVAGLHASPPQTWSEEYQISLMSKHFKAFDVLRSQGWFIGEFIWNFADSKTAQQYTRVGGNNKGIFTRNRQPKSSAHHLRKRYFLLSKQLYNVTLPEDLYEYVAPTLNIRDEL